MKEIKIRYSKQRELIINKLKHRYDHPTAEMIYQDLKVDYPHLSLGTVYRNLNQLVETKQIKKLDLGDTMVHYDGNIQPHKHFMCNCWQTIYDLDNIDKKLKNATEFLEEIDEHKKSIFEFWKYANKDESKMLAEGEVEEEETTSTGLRKTFDYEEDILQVR